MTKKVAMFVSNYIPHPGGLEVMVWNLARGLARRHEVVLVTSAYDGVHGVSREDGMTVHRLPAIHLTERFGGNQRRLAEIVSDPLASGLEVPFFSFNSDKRLTTRQGGDSRGS